MPTARAFLGAIAVVTGFLVCAPLATEQDRAPDPIATFSILGYDPDTGEVGGAVQSRVFSVGNGVLWGEAEVGMAATQASATVRRRCSC